MIKQISTSSVAGLVQGDIRFFPGMNLLVGANGTGKSRILALIDVLLSKGKLEISESPKKGLNVRKISFAGNAYRRNGISLGKGVISGEIATKGKEKLLVLYFSSNRSKFKLGNKKSSLPSKSLTKPKTFNLIEFLDWALGCVELAEEGDRLSQGKLEMISQIVPSFLSSCEGIFPATFPKKTIYIRRKEVTQDVMQLSNGERGILAIVLDLIKSLAQAYPDLENPAKEAKAVVLIDDLDLHLHPKYQHSIVGKLTSSFPKCQFIASTHSPQIISSVLSENITVLEHGKTPVKPFQALGMDANWILQFLMDTQERSPKYYSELDKISHLIEADEYELAQKRIDSLRAEIGEFPDLVRLQTRVNFFTLSK